MNRCLPPSYMLNPCTRPIAPGEPREPADSQNAVWSPGPRLQSFPGRSSIPLHFSLPIRGHHGIGKNGLATRNTARPNAWLGIEDDSDRIQSDAQAAGDGWIEADLGRWGSAKARMPYLLLLRRAMV